MSKDNQFFKEQYEAFLASIKEKDESVLVRLDSKDFGVKEMLAYNNYAAFKVMIKVNFIEALELIKKNNELLEDDIYQVITQDNHSLFSCAAENGALDSMKWIMENASQSAHSFLTKGPYKAFKIAMRKGYAEIAEQIKKWVDEKLPLDSDGIISELKDIEDEYLQERSKKRTFSEIESHDVEKRDGESWAKRVKRDNNHTVSLRI